MSRKFGEVNPLPLYQSKENFTPLLRLPEIELSFE